MRLFLKFAYDQLDRIWEFVEAHWGDLVALGIIFYGMHVSVHYSDNEKARDAGTGLVLLGSGVLKLQYRSNGKPKRR